MAQKVLGIIGSYRRGGVVESTADAVLEAAAAAGAEVTKINLLDKRIEFCTNCRLCTEQEGPHRGFCPIKDDMESIMQLIDEADALVLASPMNFGTVTALMKRFIERLIVYAYWSWGPRSIPKLRVKHPNKRAVLVTASAMPALMGRFTTKIIPLLKATARTVGARTVDVVYFGLVCAEKYQQLSPKQLDRARKAGRRLIAVSDKKPDKKT